jgi:hypothetical protein
VHHTQAAGPGAYNSDEDINFDHGWSTEHICRYRAK